MHNDENVPNVYAATERALREHGLVDSVHGQAALKLAYQIDNSALENGSSFSALVREHRMTMSAALADVEEASEEPRSKIDEIRARREQKRNTG